MTATVSADASVPHATDEEWSQANQQYLVSALAEVAAQVRAAESEGADVAPPSGLTPPAALEVVCSAFGLSPFERALLLLCAGVELDAAFAGLCANASGDPLKTWPTFSLALACLPGAHWSALTPDAPLRRWRLIELTGHGSLTTTALRIDEHVLHVIAGAPGADPKLTGIARPAPPADTTAGQIGAAHVLADLWRVPSGPLPVLVGADPHSRRAVVMHAAADLGMRLTMLDARLVPVEPLARDELARLLERDSALTATAYLAEGDDSWAGVDALAAMTQAPLAVSADEPPPMTQRAARVVDVPRATAAEQRELWRAVVGADVPVESLVAAFDLDPASIRMAAAAGGRDAEALWAACRAIDRPTLAALAQRIESTTTWDDLVLPAPQRRTLELLTAHARHRVRVYDDWRMRKGRSAGLGCTAVFSGPSGTGKTFAAEVIANDLRLDLYRVDLSAVVSKYIGETEKNLRRVFDAADHGSAVLLFDEADALFGKRTEVRDSHDRYANVEVSYLLQRMEEYRGLAILTTNMAEAIDASFLRRVRFVVNFPFPGEDMRADLWRRAFASSTPTEDIDVAALSSLDLAGGTIRNVAVNAAFLAAEAGGPVRMRDILQAARLEAGKLGQPLASLRRGVTQ